MVEKRIWGLHNDALKEELVEQGFVSIGWDELGDLGHLSGGRDGIKVELSRLNPEDSTARINSSAGVVYRFAHVMKPGDLIVAPYKPDSTINIGRVTGDYYYEAKAPLHRHRHQVKWLKTGIARNEFSQSALYELGSAITLFTVRRHVGEIIAVLNGNPVKAPQQDPVVDTPEAEDPAPDMPTATRIEQSTADFVLEAISKEITPAEFEELTADLLRALGYRARVTPYSRDGGVDVIAHRDPLGVEPPQIMVQCKQRIGSVTAPDVQQLVGAGWGSSLLFVTTGSFTRDAQMIERQNSSLRLISGSEFADLVIANYEKLPVKWRKTMPLRPVMAVDTKAE